MRHIIKSVLLLSAMVGMSACAQAQTADETINPDVESTEKSTSELMPTKKMTAKAMADLVKSFDAEASVQGNLISFTLQDREVLIVSDEKRDRMRALTPIAPADLLDEALLLRMAQANYDSVLDARYAVADGLLWSVFIHPLGSLQQEDLISAIAQVVTAAETFGLTYTSGAMVFGGGDSSEIHNDLLKKLEEAAKKRDGI